MAEKLSDPELMEEKKEPTASGLLGKKKLLILPLGVILLLSSGAGAVYFFAPQIIPASMKFWEKKAEEGEKKEEETKETKGKEPDRLVQGHIYTMDSLLVNLSDTDKLRYLKIRINLESMEGKPNEEYDKRLPQLRDSILTLLSSKTQKDIVDSEGKRRIKEEITARMNQILTQFKIQTVYFTEFVIQ